MKDRGFTLVELLVLLALIGLVSIGIARAVISQDKNGNNNPDLWTSGVTFPKAPGCVPGQVIKCPLPVNGLDGIQTCQPDGKSFGPCTGVGVEIPFGVSP